MSFEIVDLNNTVYSGNVVEIPADFTGMSEIKAKAIATYATDNTYVGINTAMDGKQCYLVAKPGTDNGPVSFELPAGTYAKFVTDATERAAIDGFIGQSYGVISQSTEVEMIGGFNLEDLREDNFTIYLPVTVK